MEYATNKSNPALTDRRCYPWVIWPEHEASQAIGANNLKPQSGNAGYHGNHAQDELGELAQTFDQMVAILRKVTAGREQLEREAVERHLVEVALKQDLEALSRTNQQLEEFTYVVSHDLQEPLRKIQKFCQILEKDLGTSLPESARQDLAYITDGANRMGQLVLDLLAFSRLGRDGVKFAPISLEQVVDQALANLALSIAEKGARIEREPLPQVTGNAALLIDLYQNLIDNALKYSEQPPEIRITAARENDLWVFGVKDHGIGIAPAYAEQIFLPFKRLHGNGHYQGSGIGLATCRKVVEAHNGTIWAEPCVERGAHFRFTLAIP